MYLRLLRFVLARDAQPFLKHLLESQLLNNYDTRGAVQGTWLILMIKAKPGLAKCGPTRRYKGLQS